jgi:outer membrane lipoprotein carrier protein
MQLTRHLPVAVGLITFASVGAAQTPAATIDRASQAFRAAGTVRATFEQTLNNPLTGNQTKSTGELAMAQPNKLSLRFAGAGDRVVADGKNVWVYLPSAAPGQVLKLPATMKSGVGLDLIDDLLSSPRSNFDVADGGTESIDGHATHAVILTPKHEGQGITKARVWVDDASGALRQVVLTQDTGLERTWHITSWVPNATLPKGTFTFEVPSGARVVDQESFRSGR